nr:FAD binding domain-containing protein [Nocardioides sp. B-3]
MPRWRWAVRPTATRSRNDSSVRLRDRAPTARPTSPPRSACCATTPDATVVAGATDFGVEVNLRGRRSPYTVHVDRLPELRTLSTGDVIEIGAGLTLSEVEEQLGGAVPLLDQCGCSSRRR